MHTLHQHSALTLTGVPSGGFLHSNNRAVPPVTLFIAACCRARIECRGDRNVKWVWASSFSPDSAAAGGRGSATPACSQRSSPPPRLHSPQRLPQLPAGGMTFTCTHEGVFTQSQSTFSFIVQISTLWLSYYYYDDAGNSFKNIQSITDFTQKSTILKMFPEN